MTTLSWVVGYFFEPESEALLCKESSGYSRLFELPQYFCYAGRTHYKDPICKLGEAGDGISEWSVGKGIHYR